MFLFLPLYCCERTYLRSDIGRLFENFLGEAERIKLQMSERSEFLQFSGASLRAFKKDHADAEMIFYESIHLLEPSKKDHADAKMTFYEFLTSLLLRTHIDL